MNQIRLKRLNHTYSEEISKILHDEMKDPDLNFVTITACDTTNDLSFAKVYYTVLEDSKKDVVAAALKKASPSIRSILSSRVNIRNTPELRFVYDDSIEYGRRIDEVIEKIKEKDHHEGTDEEWMVS